VWGRLRLGTTAVALLIASAGCGAKEPRATNARDAAVGAGGMAAAGRGGGAAPGTGGTSTAGAPGDQDAGGAGAAAGADASVPEERGGTEEAGSLDATDAATAIDAPPGCGGLFCEDFEEGRVDPARWSTSLTGGATLIIQQKTVAHGKYALQLHGPAAPKAQDYVYIIAKGAPAALAKHNFGRAYFYLSPQRNDIDMGLIFGGTAGFPKPTYLSIANHGTGWQLGFIKLSGTPTGERQAYPPGDIPVARWTCLEWEMNDDPDALSLWADGKLVGTLDNRTVGYPPNIAPGTPLYDGKNSGLIGAFTDFGFGFYDWHPENRPAFDVYYDDIALDTARVGCLP
jgi:hypothetical protein